MTSRPFSLALVIYITLIASATCNVEFKASSTYSILPAEDQTLGADPAELNLAENGKWTKLTDNEDQILYQFVSDQSGAIVDNAGEILTGFTWIVSERTRLNIKLGAAVESSPIDLEGEDISVDDLVGELNGLIEGGTDQEELLNSFNVLGATQLEEGESAADFKTILNVFTPMTSTVEEYSLLKFYFAKLKDEDALNNYFSNIFRNCFLIAFFNNPNFPNEEDLSQAEQDYLADDANKESISTAVSEFVATVMDQKSELLTPVYTFMITQILKPNWDTNGSLLVNINKCFVDDPNINALSKLIKCLVDTLEMEEIPRIELDDEAKGVFKDLIDKNVALMAVDGIEFYTTEHFDQEKSRDALEYDEKVLINEMAQATGLQNINQFKNSFIKAYFKTVGSSYSTEAAEKSNLEDETEFKYFIKRLVTSGTIMSNKERDQDFYVEISIDILGESARLLLI